MAARPANAVRLQPSGVFCAASNRRSDSRVLHSAATVAIDWSQIGIGALAQDLDQLTLDTVWMQVRPDESLDLLEQTILPAYGAGVRESGCDVTDAQLHRWYAAAAALHYSWMLGSIALRSREPADVTAHEQRFGREFAAVTGDRARVLERAVRLGERALESPQ